MVVDLRGDSKNLCFLSLHPDTFLDPLLRQNLGLFEKLDRIAQQIFVRKSRKFYCNISHFLNLTFYYLLWNIPYLVSVFDITVNISNKI